jgi:Uma2 family endonuclease
MSRVITSVGPADHGRRMSLEEFEHAEGEVGHRYELSRGVIVVVDVPDRKHLAQIDEAREQFSAYRRQHPGRIAMVAHAGECKILLPGRESERHPDLAIYKHQPPDDAALWSSWIPEIVIEVVSPASTHRDYVQKREEYLEFGVREYWIIDLSRNAMLVLRRSGDRWSERQVQPGDPCRTRLLPEFTFDLAAVFRAAGGT